MHSEIDIIYINTSPFVIPKQSVQSEVPDLLFFPDTAVVERQKDSITLGGIKHGGRLRYLYNVSELFILA